MSIRRSKTGGPLNPFEMNSAQLIRMIRLSNELDIRDRTHNLRNYPSCFVGEELVNYFVKRFGFSRTKAVRLGQMLLANDLIRHVAGEHDFEDNTLFYSFNEQKTPKKQSAISSAATDDIAQEMRQSDGVKVGIRRRWLVNYPDCFHGKEAVSWICETTGVDRQTAIEIGESMLANNRIRHVLDIQPFRDDSHLYRFV